jgi:hypothetical protein
MKNSLDKVDLIQIRREKWFLKFNILKKKKKKYI